MAMISCGSGAGLKEEFSMPFVESANYLGMNYLGSIHTWLESDNSISNEVSITIKEFTTKI